MRPVTYHHLKDFETTSEQPVSTGIVYQKLKKGYSFGSEEEAQSQSGPSFKGGLMPPSVVVIDAGEENLLEERKAKMMLSGRRLSMQDMDLPRGIYGLKGIRLDTLAGDSFLGEGSFSDDGDQSERARSDSQTKQGLPGKFPSLSEQEAEADENKG